MYHNYLLHNPQMALNTEDLYEDSGNTFIKINYTS